MTWDGEERRQNMDKDWLERDRLLSETHAGVLSIKDWAKKHDLEDIARFKEVNEKFKLGYKIGIICAIIVVANGGLEAIRVIFNIK